MKTTHAATIALLLAATLGSSYAVAADSAVQAKTRAQVQAELVEAQRTGYVMDAKSGKMLNELYPNLYPAKVSASTVTRAQVLAELAEAKRTGDIVDSKSGKKLNELFPNNYPKAS